MKSVLTQPLHHVQGDAMSQKFEVWWMPVLMKNKACYSDCTKNYEVILKTNFAVVYIRGKKFIISHQF